MKSVAFEPLAGAHSCKPNLKPRPGPAAAPPAIGTALAAARAARRRRGARRGHELVPEEVFVERAAPEGWLCRGGPLSVALDVSLDPELELEGRVYDLVHGIRCGRNRGSSSPTASSSAP